MTSPQVSTKTKRVMSGARTTGPEFHLGNYFGAIKNWIGLQHQYECFFGVMDWHAMTDQYKNAREINSYIRPLFAELIAWGLDPEACTLFVQSRVPEHLELNMIFSNLTPLGWLERVNTWKDEIEELKAKDAHNLGRFAYVVLQTADIAIYRGDLVPVGKDQVPHLELSREIVRRFNFLYQDVLPEPQPLLTEVPVVPGADGRKMSKSYNNYIPLTPEPQELKALIQKTPTDPKRVRRNDPGEPEVCPVYGLHTLFSGDVDREWVVQGCRTAGIGCGDCKAKLLSNMNTLMEKPREIKKELLQHPSRLDSIIDQGCQKARREAQKTIEIVRDAMGFHSGVTK